MNFIAHVADLIVGVMVVKKNHMVVLLTRVDLDTPIGNWLLKTQNSGWRKKSKPLKKSLNGSRPGLHTGF